jgi:hypothetical protein
VRVVRFQNIDVIQNIGGVLEIIHAALSQQPAPSPGASHRPLPKGRGVSNSEAC